MELFETFEKVRPSIIAFASKFAVTTDGSEPLFPPLIGTGFVVDHRGIAMTNRHVAEALKQLPNDPETGEPGAFAIVFTEISEENGGRGMGAAMVEINRYDILTEFTSNEDYYGERVPDLAFVQLNVKDLPALPLATDEWSVKVGMSIATAGFPLGSDPLVVYGAINQATPFLRHSSVLPFPSPYPHGFTVDVMSQGGASGSPIFRTDEPKVVGILHAGFDGTNITLAVPGFIAAHALRLLFAEVTLELEKVPSFADIAKLPGTPTKPEWRRAN